MNLEAFYVRCVHCEREGLWDVWPCLAILIMLCLASMK
jgi:hypothetical protein